MSSFERSIVSQVLAGLQTSRSVMHIIIGPRQVGKTTAAAQIAACWNGPVVTVAADLPLPPDHFWLESQWNRAATQKGCLLIIDEVQKVHGWSETIKALWDEARRMAGGTTDAAHNG